MKIKAKSVYDYKSVKALTHTLSHRFINPSHVFMGINIIAVLLLVFCFLFLGIDLFYLFLILLMFLMNMFMHCGLPKIQYNALSNLKDIHNEYTFYDDGFVVESKNDVYSSNAKLDYNMIVKVIETNDYLFVFQSKNQVFVVDKSTIIQGTIEDIRNKLMPVLNKKYKRYKY